MSGAEARRDSPVRWPWWVRLIDRLVGTVLEEGWVSPEWIEDVIGEGNDGDTMRRWMGTKGVQVEDPSGPGCGSWRRRLTARLVEPEGRREICEGLTLGVSLGTAAASVLRRVEVEELPEVLAEVIYRLGEHVEEATG